MPRAALKLAPARRAPEPISPLLIKAGLQGARGLRTYSPHAGVLGELDFLYAYVWAKRLDHTIRTRTLCDTAPPLGEGGERRQVPIESDSEAHLNSVARPFRQIENALRLMDKKLRKGLSENLATELAAEIMAGNFLKL